MQEFCEKKLHFLQKSITMVEENLMMQSGKFYKFTFKANKTLLEMKVGDSIECTKKEAATAAVACTKFKAAGKGVWTIREVDGKTLIHRIQ